MAERSDQKQMMDEAAIRDRIIIRTSIKGIIANVFLAIFKAITGLMSNSIAITLDAVNNLTDGLSSVITIIGTKLAGRKPDREHPLGHGRYEYLAAMIVVAIVLYAGITSGIESVKAIIAQETPNYSTASLIVVAAAVVVKIILGKYVKRQGKKVGSGALEASGADAMFDAILSASVLASALIYIFTGVSLEAYVGVAISAFIVKSGIDMLKETLDDILGSRADPEVTRTIKSLINEFPEVRGVYDLFINNYGPNKDIASVHVELPDTMTVDEVDVLTRKIQMKVYKETGVIITGVGVYSYNTHDNEAARIRNEVQHIVMEHEWVIQLHGFYADTENKTMRFDVVLTFDISAREAVAILMDEVKERYPDYELQIAPDIDVTDI